MQGCNIRQLRILTKKRLAIPYDEELFNALNAIEYKRNRIGNYTFDKRHHMHDDLAYALALACLAAREYGVKGVIIKV